MNAEAPTFCRVDFPSRYPHCGWWFEVLKNGYEEVTTADSVTDHNQNAETSRAPAREGNGETDRPIS